MMGNTSAKTKLLLTIALLTAVSIFVTNQVNTNGHSDVSPMLPLDYHEVSYSGHLVVDDGEHHNFILDSNISVDYESEGMYHCTLDIHLRPDWTSGSASVSYGFTSNDLSLVPVGSEAIQDDGLTIHYRYVDPSTGDVIMFRTIDGTFDGISVDGRAVLKSPSGQRSFMGFDVDVDYRPTIYYVAEQDLPLPKTVSYDVTGEENGITRSGTIEMVPQSSHLHYSDNGDVGQPVTWIRVLIDIPGSGVSGVIGDPVVSIYGDPGEMNANWNSSYLSGDVLTTVSMTLKVDQGSGLSMYGNVTVEVLDGNCDTLSMERTDFHYTGVVS